MNYAKLLSAAQVDPGLIDAAVASLTECKRRSKGALLHKLKVRWFKAGWIADLLAWENNRLIEVHPDKLDWDIEPVTKISSNGDNGPWLHETGRPIEDCWLNTDQDSAEYKEAQAACYWCKGEHPRSEKARKAWYRRNGGEYLAWRRGMLIDPANSFQMWQGSQGRLTVTVVRSGEAWLLKTTRKLVGKLGIKTRVGFEVDNVFSGPLAPQMWYPIAGHELRAPVTWSVLPAWGDQE